MINVLVATVREGHYPMKRKRACQILVLVFLSAVIKTVEYGALRELSEKMSKQKQRTHTCPVHGEEICGWDGNPERQIHRCTNSDRGVDPKVRWVE